MKYLAKKISSQIINFKTMMPLESGNIESVFDYLCWYASMIKKA